MLGVAHFMRKEHEFHESHKYIIYDSSIIKQIAGRKDWPQRNADEHKLMISEISVIRGLFLNTNSTSYFSHPNSPLLSSIPTHNSSPRNSTGQCFR